MDPGQQDRHNEARRSIVRITFKYTPPPLPPPSSPPRPFSVIIPGIIVSQNSNGTYKIIADSTFYEISTDAEFIVNCLNGENYGPNIRVSMQSAKLIRHGFIGFDIEPMGAGEIQPVIFEMGTIQTCAVVDAFIFPREEYKTSSTYCRGYIVDGTQTKRSGVGVSFGDFAIHEYGHFGSPLFNNRVHLIGIIFATQIRLHAWSVHFLKQEVLWNMRASYVLNGSIIQE